MKVILLVRLYIIMQRHFTNTDVIMSFETIVKGTQNVFFKFSLIRWNNGTEIKNMHLFLNVRDIFVICFTYLYWS
jgi:hypothetical protein